MKRILKFVMIISFSLVLVFASIGILNYIDKQDSSSADSVSAEIFNLQTEMSDLYLDKQSYEEDKAEINSKLEDLISKESASAEEKEALRQRLAEVENQILVLEKEIENATDTAEELYLKKQEFEEEKETIEQRLTLLEAEDAEIKADIESLSNRLAEIEQNISAIESQILEINSKIDDLYNLCNTKGRNIATFTFDGTINGYADVLDKIPFREYSQIGEKFSPCSDSYGICVLAGVSKVLISYAVTTHSVYTEERIGILAINGVQRNVVFGQTIKGRTTTLSCAPFVQEVTEGDVISLLYDSYGIAGDTIYGLYDGSLRTYLTIEVLE